MEFKKDGLGKFNANIPNVTKDLLKEGINLNDISKNQLLNVRVPDIPKIKIKEEPKPKEGIEGWYDRNVGKIALFSIGTTIIFAIISIIEAFLLAQK